MDLGERQLFTQLEEPTTDEFLLADLKVEIDLPDGYYFTSITSATDRDVLVVRDSTALYASVAGPTIGLPEAVYTLNAPLFDATTATGLTQELRLASGDEYTHWVLGVFYSTSERDYGQSLPVTGFETLAGIPTAGSFGAATDELFYSDLNYDFDQTAAFFELTWTAGERLDLTAGARWYDYEETRSQVFDGLFADSGPTEGETSADGVAPRFIASFEATENTQLNAQISKGFRLGGINDPLNVPVCTPEDLATFSGRDSWEDEELWNVEIGSKSTILGGRGTFNVAAFTMDISDLQTTVTAGSCSSRLIFNVPNARSTGLELELTAQPSAVFDFAISASYADSELGSTLTSTAADGTTSVVSGIEKGNRLPTVPKFPGLGRRDLALGGRRLGRLPLFRLPARRFPFHPDRRPRAWFRHGRPAGSLRNESGRRTVDADRLPLRSRAAGLRPSEPAPRLPERALGHRPSSSTTRWTNAPSWPSTRNAAPAPGSAT